MFKLSTHLLILLLLSFVRVHAQTNAFEKGYLVQSTDTIQGYIRSASDLDLSQFIQFKTDPDSEVAKDYYPGDIDAFYLEKNGIEYETVKAEIFKESLSINTTRFAKKLLSGYTSLYKLEIGDEEQSNLSGNGSTFLYILQKDTTYFTLGIYERQHGNYIIINRRYIGILRAAFMDCEQLELNLDRTKFNDKSIITAVTTYNSCKKPELQSITHDFKTKAVTKKGVEASALRLFVPQNTSGISAHGYAVGYFWDIMQPDKSRKYSTKLGVAYMYYNKSRGMEAKNEVFHLLRFPFSTQYNFRDPLIAKTVPFITFGFTALIATKLNTADLVPWPSIGAGMYRKRMRYSLLLENNGFGISNPKLLHFSIGMRLNK